MKKKDILFVCQFYSPEYVTSAELASDTCRALSEAGFSVDVLCGYPGEYVGDEAGKVPSRENTGSVFVKRVRYLRLSRKTVAGRLINYFSFYFGVLLRVFSFRHYRIVASYSNPPMVTNVLNVAKKLFKVKTVFIAHDVYPEIAIKTGRAKENGLMAGKMRRINRRLSGNVDGVICISREMAGFFEKERNIPAEKIETVPNWHRDLFGGSGAPRGGERPFTCGYFGNMGVCQDMETIVSAIEKESLEKKAGDPEINYVFAGHGTKASGIRSRLAGNANVRFCGFLRGGDFSDAIAKCDALAVSLEEGLGGLCAPSKVYSYYMAGKPVIAVTDEKDIAADIEKYGCGFVVKNGDAEGFVSALKKLAGDRSLADKMGENSRRCFDENYTAEKCCGKIAEFFGKIADS